MKKNFSLIKDTVYNLRIHFLKLLDDEWGKIIVNNKINTKLLNSILKDIFGTSNIREIVEKRSGKRSFLHGYEGIDIESMFDYYLRNLLFDKLLENCLVNKVINCIYESHDNINAEVKRKDSLLNKISSSYILKGIFNFAPHGTSRKMFTGIKNENNLNNQENNNSINTINTEVNNQINNDYEINTNINQINTDEINNNILNDIGNYDLDEEHITNKKRNRTNEIINEYNNNNNISSSDSNQEEQSIDSSNDDNSDEGDNVA